MRRKKEIIPRGSEEIVSVCLVRLFSKMCVCWRKEMCAKMPPKSFIMNTPSQQNRCVCKISQRE